MKTKKSIVILFMLVFFVSISFSQSNVKKIISYNVLEGLQQDSLNQQKFVEWVLEMDADVIAFQEMNNFTQKSLENLAREYNHPYAIQSKLDGYPVAITSKFPIVNVQKVVDNMWHAYIYANIDNIHFFVIHFSPHSLTKRLEEVEMILAHVNTLPENEPILIMGDFNSMDSSDSMQYNNEMVVNMRKREEQMSHIRNLNNGNIDYSVLSKLKENGLIDTFWLTNDSFIPSVTTPKFGTPSKRIDFIWANETAADKVLKGTIIHDESTNVMSDHYPVYIEMNFSE